MFLKTCFSEFGCTGLLIFLLNQLGEQFNIVGRVLCQQVSVLGTINDVILFIIRSVAMFSSIFILCADSVGTVNDLQNIDFLFS